MTCLTPGCTREPRPSFAHCDTDTARLLSQAFGPRLPRPGAPDPTAAAMLPAGDGPFWSRVDRSAGEDACWPWCGSRTAKGYGRIEVRGRHTRAHRVAYELTKGRIPDGRLVMHSCDNPPCCNPRHLLIGTPLDNSRDMVAKGRSTARRDAAGNRIPTRRYRPGVVRPGTRGGRPQKLNPELAAAIRAESASGIRNADLARRYDVSESVIGRIVRGLIWRDVRTSPPAAPDLAWMTPLGARSGEPRLGRQTEAPVDCMAGVSGTPAGEATPGTSPARLPLERCVCGDHTDCPDGWHEGDELPCLCTPDCALEGEFIPA